MKRKATTEKQDSTGVREQRLKGFHENEPEMHAGRVLPWSYSLSPHFPILI